MRDRFGRGAAHVNLRRPSPSVKEPEQVSKQARGIREKRLCPVSRSMTQRVEIFQGRIFRLIPCVSSEAAGSPTLLPEPLRNLAISKTVSRVNLEETARANVWATMVNALP